MTKPLIGITSNYCDDDKYFISADIGVRGQVFSAVPNDYSQAVIKAGGIPVLLPALPSDEYIDDIIQVLDGLILSGGLDIDPAITGQRMSSKIGRITSERDGQELQLIDKFYKATNKPILAICRGMQIFNAYLGGDLVLDIPSAGYLDHSLSNSKRYTHTHQVSLEENSVLFEIFGKKSIGVNSYHHQAVNKLGEGLVPIAKTEDGLVEATQYEDLEKRFILTTQWHPEMLSAKDDYQIEIFKKFVEECQK